MRLLADFLLKRFKSQNCQKLLFKYYVFFLFASWHSHISLIILGSNRKIGLNLDFVFKRHYKVFL